MDKYKNLILKHVKKITFSMRASCFYIKSDMSTFRESPPTILRLNNNTTVNMAARSFTCQLMYKILYLSADVQDRIPVSWCTRSNTCQLMYKILYLSADVQHLIPVSWCTRSITCQLTYNILYLSADVRNRIPFISWCTNSYTCQLMYKI